MVTVIPSSTRKICFLFYNLRVVYLFFVCLFVSIFYSISLKVKEITVRLGEISLLHTDLS